jgi:hypothetical protein
MLLQYRTIIKPLFAHGALDTWVSSHAVQWEKKLTLKQTLIMFIKAECGILQQRSYDSSTSGKSKKTEAGFFIEADAETGAEAKFSHLLQMQNFTNEFSKVCGLEICLFYI